ncbi:uncharacterized protein LOC132740036 [Ruditapes philippinarum]|uniref:uncharacterized protein LOC132740036 n=1 Tax=Ruditapes philippinarum TaxID=129788 RepID=UPI00295C0032|nr:uncharacterized protein LOC132740036 [Ruditapes philippinarum]
MEGYKVFFSTYIVVYIVLPFHVNTMLMMEPNFVSSWYDMKAQAGTNTTLLSIEHGLGETPLLVDVQVLGKNGRVFPGSGCRARDDDQPEGYGGIIYIYNDVYIEISSPMQSDGHLGRCIYTGKMPYWNGFTEYDSYFAQVRARAWKKSTLPPADFVKTGQFIASGAQDNYFEEPHGLGDYPSLVISRTKFPSSTETYPDYYSDSVGSSMGMYDNTSTQNAFVVYGFSNESIRVWAPTSEADYIFAGTDGWNFNVVKNGTLELYAWRNSSLTTSLSSIMYLTTTFYGPGLRITDIDIANGNFVKAWVQATSGVNSGFRFVGNGNLAYDEVKTAAGCSYGGLVYAYDKVAYDNSYLYFWQPGPGNGESNGALICIANGMGGGKNVQASNDRVIVAHIWDLDSTSTSTYSTELSTATQPSTTGGISYSPTFSSSVEQRTTLPTSTHLTTPIIPPITTIPDCDSPPDIAFGYVEVSGTSLGSYAKCVCHQGYELIGIEFIQCQPDGNWGPMNLVECRPVDCGPLRLSINNSEETTFIPKNSTHFGSVALIKCKVGYSFSNGNTSVTFICSEKAAWNSNVSITCSPVYCSRPEVTDQPTIEGADTTYTVDSVIHYSCENGYVLEGYRSRVCLKSGQWSGSAPKCIKAPSKQASPCEKNTDSHGQVWNVTNPGETRVFPCSKINQDLSDYVTRKCSTEGKWLLPHYNCIRKALEEITDSVNIIKETPTTETVVHVLDQLSSLTNQTESNKTYSGELEAVTSTLEIIATIDYTNITINDSLSTSFFETTSNLLNTSNTESWHAIGDQSSASSEASSGASKVLDVISNFTDAISRSFNRSGGGNFSKTFDNLVLEIRSIHDSPNIKFPPTGSQNASLDLPKASLTGSTIYSAVLYKNLSGMMSINTAFSGNNIEFGSSVMSVKLDKWTKVNDFNITLTFQHFETDQQLSAICSYRNASSVLWGNNGCKVKRSDNYKTVCECDHLTNFAILMSPWTKENVETEAIRIISIVGCSISMLCLIITMLTHICYWKFVKSDRVKILMSLCFALLISYSIFLGGVDRTANEDVCTTIAVLLQYIYLVVFSLMLAEAVEISFVILYVFTTESRLKWILPLAWLLPAVIVGISLAVTQTKGYGNDKSCWLSIDDGLIWAFVGPALLIILVNFILIVLVLKAIFKTKTLSQKSLKERTMAGIRCLCVLLPLVGCTWVIGIFYVNEDLAWIQYVFAVCNGLQGLAIFVFHCLLNTQIRHAYQRKKRYSSSGLFTRSTSNPILVPRAMSNSSTSDIYNSINDSYGSETTYHLDRDVRVRRPGAERIELKHYSDRR